MKRVLILILLLSAMLLSSCKLFTKYEDTNGDDDYTLQSITEEMIIKDNHYLKQLAILTTNTSDGITVLEYSADVFDGVEELHCFNHQNVSIIVDINVEKGNARLVITDGKSIIHDFNINQELQSFEISNDKRYYLKIAGESAKYSLKVSYQQ